MINTKEQTVISAIKDAFEGKNMQTQYSVLGYRINLYFHEYKLVIEVDELGHNDRNIDLEIQREHQKENLIMYLLELILMRQNSIFIKKQTKYIDTLMN